MITASKAPIFLKGHLSKVNVNTMRFDGFPVANALSGRSSPVTLSAGGQPGRTDWDLGRIEEKYSRYKMNNKKIIY
jgi:hypothetical protein